MTVTVSHMGVMRSSSLIMPNHVQRGAQAMWEELAGQVVLASAKIIIC